MKEFLRATLMVWDRRRAARAKFVVSRGIAGRYFKEIITYDYVPPSTLSPRGAIASFSLYREPVLSHVGRSQKVIPS